VLGDKISLDTIDGTKILVTIPEHSEVGSNLRIPSKGNIF
jgi:DnaJ-class molecular chaperone